MWSGIRSSAGVTFNVLTIALPKIVDERLARDVPLVLIGSIATAVLICGALAQLTVGRLVERIPPHILFAIVTGLGALGNLWAASAAGNWSLIAALAIAIAAIYGQVTVNDIVIARSPRTPGAAASMRCAISCCSSALAPPSA